MPTLTRKPAKRIAIRTPEKRTATRTPAKRIIIKK